MTASDEGQALFEGAFGAVYAAYMGHPPIARVIGRIVWGGDGWLEQAQLTPERVRESGCFAYFSATARP